MDAFDAFSDADAEIAAAAKRVAEITLAYAEYEATIAPMLEEDAELNEQIKALEEQSKALRLKRHELDTKKREVEWDKRKRAREKELAEQALLQAQNLKRAAAEFSALEGRWDGATIGAPWREWAKDHQIVAGHRMAYAERLILADTMGLGKTLSAILTLDMIANPTDMGGRKVIYFCPPTVMTNVIEEFRRWAPHRSPVLLGGQSKATRNFLFETLEHADNFVIVVNYEAWRRDSAMIDHLIKLQPDTVIIDEAHNIKDITSIGFKGIKKICREVEPKYIFPMTGTPVLNKPQELFSLLHLVDPETFYSQYSFENNFCQFDMDTQKYTWQPGGLERLAKRIANRFLRRTKDQAGIVLPDLTVIDHTLSLDEEKYPKQFALYKEMREKAMIMLDPEQGKAIVAQVEIALRMRLRQMVTWGEGIVIKDPRTHEVLMQVECDESVKIDEIIRPNGTHKDYSDPAGLLPEILGGNERVAIWSQFKAPLHELKRRCDLAGIRSIVLDGDTPDKLKEEIRHDFDARTKTENPEYEHKYDVVICNYKVGGVGLNFTEVSQMIVLDEEWNPGKREQAYDRMNRIGQTKAMTVHVLLVEKSVDTWMRSIMDTKEALIGGFNQAVGDGEDMLAALKAGLI